MPKVYSPPQTLSESLPIKKELLAPADSRKSNLVDAYMYISVAPPETISTSYLPSLQTNSLSAGYWPRATWFILIYQSHITLPPRMSTVFKGIYPSRSCSCPNKHPSS